MPLLPEIPGFYYDNEKKKYFKVTPNHVANSKAYSADRVKHEQEQAKEADLQRRETENVRPLLKRPRRTSESSPGLRNYRLRMEMGFVKSEMPQKDGDGAVWANMLHEGRILVASVDRQLSGMELLADVGGLFTFAPTQCMRYYPMPYDHFYEQRRVVSPTKSLPEMNNRMTSTARLPSGNRIIVSCNKSYATFSISKHGNPQVEQVTTIPQAGTIWSCIGNAQGTIALGGSCKTGQKGLLSLRSGESSDLLIKPESDVLALEYLDNNILLSGSRNGKIHIYDSRKNLEKEISYETAIASHVSSITHLRKLNNDHHILVNGLGGQASLQDLRFCRPMPAHQRGMHKTISTPVLTYPTFNRLTIGLGFDTSPDGHMMAVAGDDYVLRLYSISSGRLIKQIGFHGEIPSIKFSSDPVDTCSDFYVASGSTVYRYSTGSLMEIDYF